MFSFICLRLCLLLRILNTFRIIMYFWWIDFLIIMQCFSLFVVIFQALNSTLANIYRATFDFNLQLMFSSYTIFHLFMFNLCMLLNLKRSSKQKKSCEFCLFVCFLSLLVAVLRPFMFSLIVDMLEHKIYVFIIYFICLLPFVFSFFSMDSKKSQEPIEYIFRIYLDMLLVV